MPKPPKEVGREALSQDQSGRGPPARSVTASRMVLTKAAMDLLMWLGGQV